MGDMTEPDAHPKPDIDIMPTFLDDIVRDIIIRAAEGCCNNEKWSGGLCPYHAAFGDGLDTLAVRMSRAILHLVDDD